MLHRLRLGPRLAAAFLSVAILSASSGVIALVQMSSMRDRAASLVEVSGRKTQLLHTMTNAVHVESRVVRSALLLKDDAARREEQLQKIHVAREQYEQAWAELQKFHPSAQAVEIRAHMQAAREHLVPIDDRIVEMARAGNQQEAVDLLMQQALPGTNDWLSALQDNDQLQVKANADEYARSIAAYHQGWFEVFAMDLCGLAVAVALTWWVAQGVRRPLRRAVMVAERVAQGDLATPIEVSGHDETSDLLRALEKMQQGLREVVQEVRCSVQSLEAASAEIATGNNDLSVRTERQASSLQETTSSMSELSDNVVRTTGSAEEADNLALTAARAARDGGSLVSSVVSTMSEIQASSQRIGDIVGVIDGIAFQTNILALNAAVEAARAGEQGRGFEVVAAEVRALAQRSAGAAREIKSMITASVERVENGTALVADAGRSMAAIVEQVEQVSSLVTQITESAKAQSHAITKVTQAVASMDEGTQQNAALVEESAAAASSLADQARSLSGTMARFRLALA
jgi:methyl-accepting chemotaxis protein